jgi:ferredoxin
MGEIGYSRVFLSREYGPAQRLYFLLTEAELEADPIQEGICDRCMQCVRHCPAHALSTSSQDDLDIPDIRHIVRSALDMPRCITVNGGGLSQFASEEIVEQTRNLVDGQGDRTADGTPYPSIREISDLQHKHIGYARNAQEYFASPASLCAGEGCMRACLAHLERKDALGARFRRPFRPD